MNNTTAVLLVLFSAMLAAISQVLLKLSVRKKHRSFLFEYLNPYVICSYALLFSSALCNMFAMEYIPFKSLSVLGTLSYIFVMLLSRILLKEKMGNKQYLGAVIIISGILIYNL